ncbi:FadR/GntR family transcriptional regulator [Siminovitchia terrae]|uniref:FadR/GntR family transcriptional regulator n=1 Tax=Siminovitchia terrae TaxID=1914933 RepID=UPI0028B1FC2B|nr:FCD domain-containing protein [Siminovitchia terrae]
MTSNNYPDLSSLKHVSAQKVSDHIFEQLKESIILKEILPEEQLPPERELCSIFNASRLTVREAIQRLKEEGLVEQIRGAKGGTFILPLTAKIHEKTKESLINQWDEFQDIFVFRNFIEPYTAKMAALNISEEKIEELHQLNNQISAPCEREEFRSNDVKFHLKISEIAKNIYFQNSVRMIRTKINPALDLLPFNEDVRKKTYEEHQFIIESIEKQDKSTAKKVMYDHIFGTTNKLEEIIRE